MFTYQYCTAARTRYRMIVRWRKLGDSGPHRCQLRHVYYPVNEPDNFTGAQRK